jgi:hypothetical protein
MLLNFDVDESLFFRGIEIDGLPFSGPLTTLVDGAIRRWYSLAS